MTFEILSGMLGLPEGRDRATPILAKIKFGYFFQNYVCVE